MFRPFSSTLLGFVMVGALGTTLERGHNRLLARCQRFWVISRYINISKLCASFALVGAIKACMSQSTLGWSQQISHGNAGTDSAHARFSKLQQHAKMVFPYPVLVPLPRPSTRIFTCALVPFRISYVGHRTFPLLRPRSPRDGLRMDNLGNPLDSQIPLHKWLHFWRLQLLQRSWLLKCYIICT
jgi:hypothetical protein